MVAAGNSRTVCNSCNRNFESRGQLFKHLRSSACSQDNPLLVARPAANEKVALLIGYLGQSFQGLQACAGKSDTSSESPHQSVESVISSRIFPNAPSEPNTAAFARAVETGIGVNAIGNVLVAKLPKLVQLTNDVSPEVAAAAALSAEAGWLREVNAKLGPELRVFNRTAVTEDFHPEKRCERRRYEYLLPYSAVYVLELDGPMDPCLVPPPNQHKGPPSPIERAWHRNVQQRLRPVLKAFTGVHQFHNYNCRAPAGAPAPPHPEEGGGMGASCPPQSLAPTAPAPEDESMNWRRMFRSYCVGTVRLHEEDFAVVSLATKSAKPLEMQRVMGMVVAVMRGAASMEYLRRSLQEDAHVLVPTAPASHLFLANVHYDKYLAQFKEPPMGALRHQLGAQLDAAMEAPNGVRLEGWRDTLRARVAEEHVRGSSPFKSWVHHLQTHFQPTDFAAPTTLEATASATVCPEPEGKTAAGQDPAPPPLQVYQSAKVARGVGGRGDVATRLRALQQRASWGGDLFLMRGMNRTMALFSQEFQSLARLCGVGPDEMHELNAVLWALEFGDGQQDSDVRGAALARDQLVGRARRSAGMRTHARHLCSAASPALLLEEARRCSLHYPVWTLTHERLFPPADPDTLPFLSSSDSPALAIRLAAVIGGRYAEPGEAATNLVLIELGDAFVLCLDLSSQTHHPIASHADCPLPQGPIALDAPVSPTYARTLQMWANRPFSFNASLDFPIAVAALNVTACAHLAHKQRQRASSGDVSHAQEAGGILDGMTVLDPCCGSGTVPAMACALGARAVLTSDLRAEFLKKTQSNFQHAGIRSHNLALAGESAHTHQGCSGEDILPTLVTLFEHDAKTPFPQEYTAAHQQGEGIDIVVANPPWGRNIGTGEDTFAIVHNVMSCFPRATAGFIMSECTFQSLVDMQNRHHEQGRDLLIEIQQQIRLGTTVLVVLRRWEPVI